MTRVYYKEAVAAMIVFDVTRVATFEAVQKWKKDIDDKVGSVIILQHTCSPHTTPPTGPPAQWREYPRRAPGQQGHIAEPMTRIHSHRAQCDQAKEGLVQNSEQMDKYCADKGFIGWYETSAKENVGINQASEALVRAILHAQGVGSLART